MAVKTVTFRVDMRGDTHIENLTKSVQIAVAGGVAQEELERCVSFSFRLSEIGERLQCVPNDRRRECRAAFDHGGIAPPRLGGGDGDRDDLVTAFGVAEFDHGSIVPFPRYPPRS